MTESIVVNFEPKESNEFEPEDELSSPKRLLEYDSGPYSVGDTVDIYVWGTPLSGLNLSQASNGLGVGEEQSLSDEEQVYSEDLSFSGSSIEGTTFPIAGITSLIALTAITKVDEDFRLENVASAGSNLSGVMGKIGGSAFGTDDSDEKFYGAVQANYDRVRSGLKWSFTFLKTGIHWFFIKDGSDVVYQFSIDVGGEEGGSAIKDVTLIYTNYITDAPVEGATVYFDVGSLMERFGITDVNGKVTFTNVITGVHFIKSIKTGFLDSDEDDIENDEILVS